MSLNNDDQDFQVFMLIDSECDGLPIGSVRQHWAPEALARKESDVQRAERWAMEVGREAFQSLVDRFAGVADHEGLVLQAALSGDGKRLQVLLDSGADVDAWDENGMTPLLSAVFVGDSEAVRLLLAAGADPNRAQRNDRTSTPLWHARDDFGLREIAALLVKAGAVDPTAA
jgi:ankyrin repeat protein